MSSGSTDRTEIGLENEISSLRGVMDRLLVEEEDLARLVAGIARLSTAIVQAVRVQLTIAETSSDPLADAIDAAWAELERRRAMGIPEEIR